jgi:hypothetical protein
MPFREDAGKAADVAVLIGDQRGDRRARPEHVVMRVAEAVAVFTLDFGGDVSDAFRSDEPPPADGEELVAEVDHVRLELHRRRARLGAIDDRRPRRHP